MPSERDRLAWIKVPEVTAPEAYAIKALAAGTASADQQRSALDFIVRRICRTDEPSFVIDPDGGDRASAYVEGRRSVGLALRTLIALPAENLRSKDDGSSDQPVRRPRRGGNTRS